ncbi:winged helix-turn-helix transcriptional regulator [Acetonema longum]|uniref:Transcriptional regulator, HxlR family protein n=1 Tax=Acetonema longum DSM 6540 TaxID=1009370 RepID=F7NDZ0_9FIRM|nr:helix-turn-helix domain-containing protein [Acetonema longum]EGO65744.1 transcriptional regulator, HxlR family protein [Acetonema longum DSM 6540]
MPNCTMNECGKSVVYTLSVVGGKWKWIILAILFENGVQRYGEIKKSASAITHKMLSQQLKELEAEQLILREEYHQIPPKVEYSLTEKGKTLIPIIQLMADWGTKYKPSK